MIIGSSVFNPGDMRTQVTLQKRAVSVETGGFDIPNPVTLATLMVKWVNVHGSEAWMTATSTQSAHNPQAFQAATVTMRYRKDVDLTCALLKGTELWEIVSMDDIHDEHVLIELKVQRMRSG